MKMVMGRYLRKILCILLAVALCLQGCTGTEKTENNRSIGEEAVTDTDRFERMCLELFREEVAADAITLNYMLADPSAYGIIAAESAFCDNTLEGMEENRKEQKLLMDRLEQFDENCLTDEQKLTRRILMEYLENSLSIDGLELYEEPLSATIGVQAQLPVILAEFAFRSRADVETYLDLLSQVDVYFGQILDFEEAKAEKGIFMGNRSLELVLASCDACMEEKEGGMLDVSFRERLENLPELTQEEKDGYIEENLELLRTDYIPAYRTLAEGLAALKGAGGEEPLLADTQEGKKYYEYLVRTKVAASYESVSALETAVRERINGQIAQMRQMLSENPDLINLLLGCGFIDEEPAVMLEELKNETAREYPVLSDYEYTVKYVPVSQENSLSPAFYLTPPLDKPTENVIYINRSQVSEDLYTTLAHEGYPGHMYQRTYYAEKKADPIRYLLNFTSYTEGWASYVEMQSYLFPGNGLPEEANWLFMLNASVILGMYAYMDIEVNYRGWSRAGLEEFVREHFDVQGELVDEMYDAFMSNPANYLTYYTGYLEILEMREEAENTLGKNFDAIEFHTFLLDLGPAPFPVVREYFAEWMNDCR